jgi:hypothetical protein
MFTVIQIDEEVDRYRRRLDELYGDVRLWVTSRYANAAFSQSRVDLSEEATGTYEVQSLEIAIPGLPAVRFVPRGIFMVGASGRVDVRSRLGREVLVWQEPDCPSIPSSTSVGNDVEHLIGRPLFPNVSQGWAWADPKRNEVLHLDEGVFYRLFIHLTQ